MRSSLSQHPRSGDRGRMEVWRGMEIGWVEKKKGGIGGGGRIWEKGGLKGGIWG